MKRISILLLNALLATALLITPVMAHEGVPHNPSPDDEATHDLAQHTDDLHAEESLWMPEPSGYGLTSWTDTLVNMKLYETLLYVNGELPITEVLATDAAHDEIHASEYIFELFHPDMADAARYGKGGCHGNIKEYKKVCKVYILGIGINCAWVWYRTHYRHCPNDKCGAGNSCP